MLSLKNFFRFNASREGASKNSLTVFEKDLSKVILEKLSSNGILHNYGLISRGVNSDQNSKFSIQVAKLVTSEKFIDKLSSEIGAPGVDESEEAFVLRAKSVLRKLLSNELSG